MHGLSNARSIVHKGVVVAELRRLEVEALKLANSLKLPILLHFKLFESSFTEIYVFSEFVQRHTAVQR